MGSAILLFSCERDEAEDAAASEETMRTEYSENLSIVESQNGRRSYHFVTPLVAGYSLTRRCIRRRAYARTRCQARRRSGSGPAARSQGCARQTGVRRGACRSPAQNGTAADEAGGSETGR